MYTAELRFASPLEIEGELPLVDLVIGAVLVHGARAPRVLNRTNIGLLRSGSVLVDVSIDQGGCFETSRATTLSEPSYELGGIVHCCVANLPSAVPVTSTRALAIATLPYVISLARGPACGAAVRSLRGGLNVAAGR